MMIDDRRSITLGMLTACLVLSIRHLDPTRASTLGLAVGFGTAVDGSQAAVTQGERQARAGHLHHNYTILDFIAEAEAEKMATTF